MILQLFKTHKKLFIIIAILTLLTNFVVSAFYIYNRSQQKNTSNQQVTTSANQNSSEADQPLTIASYIINEPNATIFSDAIRTFNYDKNFRENGPYTVFLPSDSAYQNLPPETAESYINYDQEANFRNVLNYHVVRGKYSSSDFKNGMTLETEQGEKITITRVNDFWILNGYSHVQVSDIQTANGVIHVITNFIFPPSMIRASQQDTATTPQPSMVITPQPTIM